MQNLLRIKMILMVYLQAQMILIWMLLKMKNNLKKSNLDNKKNKNKKKKKIFLN